jgi:hypothetical protein
MNAMRVLGRLAYHAISVSEEYPTPLFRIKIRTEEVQIEQHHSIHKLSSFSFDRP